MTQEGPLEAAADLLRSKPYGEKCLLILVHSLIGNKGPGRAFGGPPLGAPRGGPLSSAGIGDTMRASATGIEVERESVTRREVHAFAAAAAVVIS